MLGKCFYLYIWASNSNNDHKNECLLFNMSQGHICPDSSSAIATYFPVSCVPLDSYHTSLTLIFLISELEKIIMVLVRAKLLLYIKLLGQWLEHGKYLLNVSRCNYHFPGILINTSIFSC